MKRLLIVVILLTNAIYARNSVDDSVVNVYAIATPINFNITKGSVKSIAYTHKNVGNLRSVKTGKFRYFNSFKDGYNALLKDISIKQSGKSAHINNDATIAEFISVYAPPSENNTDNYIRVVCNLLSAKADVKFATIDVRALAKAIIYVEDYNLYNEMYNNN